MFSKALTKLFGSRNERLVRAMRKDVDRIGAFESELQGLDEAALRERFAGLRERVSEAGKLDPVLPEAFALVREMSRRVLEMRHFDVQLIGGMVLHQGKIAEMRTGEGKTLVATLPAALNALAGPVHVITVNDYLARRDAAWMGRLYHALGLSVGVINSSGGRGPDSSSYRFDPAARTPDAPFDSLVAVTRREAYACDIVYGTNNEFGFDYLRDNMAFSREEQSQRELRFAIVDEVDSILIDEARTPLIISGPTDESSALYERINVVIPKLQRQQEEDGPGDFTVDEKTKQAYLTEEGHEHAEALLVESGLLAEGSSLYDPANVAVLHHLHAALRAHNLFARDVDYIVQNNQVVIVDEFTGRQMPGRRWSDGLHQAVEAKEHVSIQNENQTLASITFQNYFRLYGKLAGMTGTADTEAYEFQQIYGLEVVVIPTHRPMVRVDNGDLVYLTPAEKYSAIVEDIRDCVERGQPVLVGTASIETSEHIAKLLAKEKIRHEVLNAKQHDREAHIVEQAGRPGAVTIATNMAGRGTDIVLGGNLEAELRALGDDAPRAEVERVRTDWKARHEQVLAAGGLHIVGTERHESRRIDNQLRGRSGRQGDPGSSRFYLSLQDNLMRIFASDRVAAIMQKLGMKEGEAIEHPWVSRAIENAQRKVEGYNFDIRKQLLEYDDVANDQRKVIYEQRSDLMGSGDISETVAAIRYDVLNALIDAFMPRGSLEEQWDVDGLTHALAAEFALELPIRDWLDADDDLHEEALRERIFDQLKERYADKERRASSTVMRDIEKAVMLQVVDGQWKDHLAAMDYLRQGIHLRGYAQKNPKQEYKREAFEMFTGLLESIKRETIAILSRIQVRDPADVAAIEAQHHAPTQMRYQHAEASALSAPGAMPGPGPGAGDPSSPDAESRDEPFVRSGRKVGRNEPCPCGSGKKYKQCHGRLS
ncbi:MAG: preprotein translocase subunit SecA [Chromatiales bacterium]|nr:preprotein translocase subunit SecA [Chromatiales bacterium]